MITAFDRGYRTRATMFVGAILALAIASGCAGPQPLSLAIRPADEKAYVAALASANGDAREAFAAWIATERGISPAAILTEDAKLSEKRNPFNVKRNSGAVSRGAVIYKTHCAGCHGSTAAGDGSTKVPGHKATSFKSFNKRLSATLFGGSPKKWYRTIRDGKGDVIEAYDEPTTAMPPFGDELTREQIWLVVTYLQSLDKYAPESKEQSPK